MKLILAVAIATTLASLSFLGASLAQPANPPTPTTRILAIGTVNLGVDPAAVRSILPTEVRETVKLYLDGHVQDEHEATSALLRLPLVDLAIQHQRRLGSRVCTRQDRIIERVTPAAVTRTSTLSVAGCGFGNSVCRRPP